MDKDLKSQFVQYKHERIDSFILCFTSELIVEAETLILVKRRNLVGSNRIKRNTSSNLDFFDVTVVVILGGSRSIGVAFRKAELCPFFLYKAINNLQADMDIEKFLKRKMVSSQKFK